MHRNRLTFWLGLGTLAYWVLYHGLMWTDAYFAHPALGEGVKVLLPIAVIANLLGIAMALRVRPRGLLLALHAGPLAVLLGALWYLFFGVAI